ncbi:Sugar ABC transporter substrate-binding protein [Frankia sp. Hr75.2]|nr:Sugar ABC transporter substrate-binding protein [Frankia sp. Hr75.2]
MKSGYRVAVAALAAAAVALSACSSSGTNARSTSSNDVVSSGASSDDSGVAAAEAATARNKQAPTVIPLREPLKAKPIAGKTLVWMKCDLSQCQIQANALKQATAAVGWHYQEISYKSADPATLVSALKQALNFKPTAVGVSAIPLATWQTVLPAYKAAGTVIVTAFLGQQKYDDTLIGQAGAAKDSEQSGQYIGNWVVADSKGQAHILLETVNDYPIVHDFNTGVETTVKQNCPKCKITLLNNTIPQVLGGQVPQTIVAALQKDPSIQYVVTANGPFIAGLTSALSAAGLSGKIKIAGEGASAEDLANVKTGQEHAWTPTALNYSAWIMLDMVLRHMQGMQFDPDGDGGLPQQLLTKDVSFTPSDSYDKPADYAEQLKKLWHVG